MVVLMLRKTRKNGGCSSKSYRNGDFPSAKLRQSLRHDILRFLTSESGRWCSFSGGRGWGRNPSPSLSKRRQLRTKTRCAVEGWWCFGTWGIWIPLRFTWNKLLESASAVAPHCWYCRVQVWNVRATELCCIPRLGHRKSVADWGEIVSPHS
jgi:hypothetical protein